MPGMQYYKSKAKIELQKYFGSSEYKLRKYNIKPIHKNITSNIAIFDFDDTLFPTTWEMSNSFYSSDGSKTQDERSWKEYMKLDFMVKRAMTILLKNNYTIFIVTNANTEWVNVATTDYMPILHSMIKYNKIQLVSGNDLYSRYYPDDPSIWKICSYSGVYRGVIENNKSERVNNIISFGDSVHDIYSAWMLHSKVKSIRTYKYMIHPTMKQLQKQTSVMLKRLSILNKKALNTSSHVNLSKKR